MEDGSGSKLYVIFLTCFATIGGLLFGYDTGIVSGSMLLIRDVYNLSTIWQELIVSATIGAAALFSLVAGVLSDRLGRKTVIMFASFVFTIGAVVMAAANGKAMLLGGRIIVGIGIGFASMSVPVYVAEVAPAHIRGALVTLNQLFITIGIVISSVIAGAFSENKENGWRYMLGLAGIPSVIQFLGFFFLPESPRYLVARGDEDKARACLEKVRGTKEIDHELKEIIETVEENRQYANANSFSIFYRMMTTQPVRSALFLGCLMQLFQQLCGINTVIYYSASILRMSGFPSELAIWLVCVPNAVNFLCTFIGIWLVEKAGRRILTLLSFVGIIIALVILAVGFQLSDIHSPDVIFKEASDNCSSYSVCQPCINDKKCGFCYEDGPNLNGSCLPVFEKHPERYAYLANTTFRCDKTNYDKDSSSRSYVWADNYCPTDYTWMAVLGLALFVMGFAPGLGPNPWTVNSEIYPMWARGTGTSIATAVNWICNLIVSLTFLTLTETITSYGTFYLFAGISFIGMVVMFVLLPETKDKTLEEVEELFMSASYKAKHKANVNTNGMDNKGYENEKESNSRL